MGQVYLAMRADQTPTYPIHTVSTPHSHRVRALVTPMPSQALALGKKLRYANERVTYSVYRLGNGEMELKAL